MESAGIIITRKSLLLDLQKDEYLTTVKTGPIVHATHQK